MHKNSIELIDSSLSNATFIHPPNVSPPQVTINNTKYAVKRLHEVLLETDEPGGVERITQNFLQECRLISKIRHPVGPDSLS